jgi:hypothetical protein
MNNQNFLFALSLQDVFLERIRLAWKEPDFGNLTVQGSGFRVQGSGFNKT